MQEKGPWHSREHVGSALQHVCPQKTSWLPGLAERGPERPCGPSVLKSVKDSGSDLHPCQPCGCLQVPRRRVVLAVGTQRLNKASETSLSQLLTDKGPGAQRGEGLAM